ncbi:hypothetical protein VSS86_21800, partial [Bacillus safensis]|uniref:hypothetical protein n=1 Tax=Bacillus safensis TaxID=561879 RepID=UPI002DD43029
REQRDKELYMVCALIILCFTGTAACGGQTVPALLARGAPHAAHRTGRGSPVGCWPGAVLVQ